MTSTTAVSRLVEKLEKAEVVSTFLANPANATCEDGAIVRTVLSEYITETLRDAVDLIPTLHAPSEQ